MRLEVDFKGILKSNRSMLIPSVSYRKDTKFRRRSQVFCSIKQDINTSFNTRNALLKYIAICSKLHRISARNAMQPEPARNLTTQETSSRMFIYPAEGRNIMNNFRQAFVMTEISIPRLPVAMFGYDYHSQLFCGISTFTIRFQPGKRRAIK